MTANDTIIAWIDTETTGLSANDDELLEVACVLTFIDGAPVNGTEFTAVVGASPDYRDSLREEAAHNKPVVEEMHTKNGLWDALPDGEFKTDVEAALRQFIQLGVADRDQRPLVGGASVRHDQNFLESHMPEVYGDLHYRSIDVSGLRNVLVGNGLATALPDDGDADVHRALPDILRSLAEYRHLLGQLARKSDLDAALAELAACRQELQATRLLLDVEADALDRAVTGAVDSHMATLLLEPILTAARAEDYEAVGAAVSAAVKETTPTYVGTSWQGGETDSTGSDDE